MRFLILSIIGLALMGVATASAAMPITPGDADCDGDLTAKDALFILHEVAADPVIGKLICTDNLDADSDGDIDAVDALTVLRTIPDEPLEGEIIFR